MFRCLHLSLPYVAVEWLVFLHLIQQRHTSNPAPEVLRSFLQFLYANMGMVPQV
jgi:hypothetical protein